MSNKTAFPFLDVRARDSLTLMQNYMRKAPTFLFYNVCVGESPFNSIGSNGQKEVSTIKIDRGGPEIWKKKHFHPNHLRGGVFLAKPL